MSTTIESILHENRVFTPSRNSWPRPTVSGMDAYKALCRRRSRLRGFTGASSPRNMWSGKKPFTKVLDESNAPFLPVVSRRQPDVPPGTAWTERRSWIG